ncbi:MAG: peroxiredoxin [Candidatus Aenigmarchaeota archaeon]|nr:peroxiredoxin [Candidatus Aenigmarchaeota archaeon]
MAEIGEKAPDFKLYDFDKNERKLSEFLGKKTIIAFYPGAFTSICTKELCTFRDNLSELNALNAQIVGISVDSPFANKAFAEKNLLSFPLLSDFDRDVVKKYGVLWNSLGGVNGYDTANRAIFILDENGKVVYKWVAENPGVEPDYEEIKTVLLSLPEK